MENYEANIKLKEYLERHIKQMSVDEKYHPLLVDILMRRAYEFGFTSSEIKQDVKSLVNNLNSIRIDKMPEGYESAAGVYCAYEKEIILNKDTIKTLKKAERNQVIFEILTHEVYHSLSRDENGRDRLASINSITGNYNSALLEAIVEKAADRTVYSRGENDENAPYYHQNRFGYHNITFITDAITACYGVSEKSFLKNAILGRRRVSEVLDHVANEKNGAASEFLDGIEVNYTKIHKNFYKKDENNRINPNAEEVLESMKSMHRLCEWKFQSRMVNAQITSIEQAEFLLDLLKYNHNKLFTVMRDAVNVFEKNLGTSMTYKFLEGTQDQRFETKTRISEMSQLLENKDKFSSEEELLGFIDLARNGNIKEEERAKLEEKGIKLKKPEIFFDVSKKILDDRMKMDFSNTNWNNKKIEKITQNTIIRKKMSERIKDTIVSLSEKINKVFKPKQQLLGPGQSEIKEEQIESNTSTFGALSAEELQEFHRKETEILKEYSLKSNEPERNIEIEEGPTF